MHKMNALIYLNWLAIYGKPRKTVGKQSKRFMLPSRPAGPVLMFARSAAGR